MLWLEEKYINLLGSRLPLFHKVKHHLWAFRCPICGDSKKNKSKTRGGFYLHPRATNYTMGCFNCGASMSFANFLKLQDSYLFNEFSVERYKARQELNAPVTTAPTSSQSQPKKQHQKLQLGDLECIADLSDDHPAVKYLLRRKIGPELWNRLYFVLRFKKWEAEFRGERLSKNVVEHPRLIIPFFDKAGNITRISARAFGKEDPKYIFIKVKEDASRVFGLDTVNPNAPVYVFEGPLDSLFFKNAIAVGSASLIVPELSDFSKTILVPDNQPRNPEVVKTIKKMVDSGLPVCLWDKDWGKDVNEMVINGHSIDDIVSLVNKSTVSGIEAKLKFCNWAKVSY